MNKFLGSVDKYKNWDAWIQLGLLGVVFFLPFSLLLARVFFYLALAAWLGRNLQQARWQLVRTPLDLPVLCFFLIAGLSVVRSPQVFSSAYNYAFLAGHYVVLYYLLVNAVTRPAQIKQLMQSLLGSALLVSLYGLYQYFHGPDISHYGWVDDEQFPWLRMRVFATMENPNIFAGYLVGVIGIAAGLLFTVRTMKTRLWYVVMLILFSVCLLLTYSRGAWLSLLGVVGVLGMLSRRRLCWLLVIIPAVFLVIHHSFAVRLVSIFNPVDTSSALRLAVWESTLAMIQDHPFFGIGWGAYPVVYPAYDFFMGEQTATMYHAHNMYLHIGAETGLIGLAAFFWLFLAYGFIAAKMLKTDDPYLRGLTLGLVAALVGLLVNGLTDYIMFNINMSLFFWFVLGITVAAAAAFAPASITENKRRW